MRSHALLAAASLVMLAGCARHADDPGAITADEDRQLNQAAATLDNDAAAAPDRNESAPQ